MWSFLCWCSASHMRSTYAKKQKRTKKLEAIYCNDSSTNCFPRTSYLIQGLERLPHHVLWMVRWCLLINPSRTRYEPVTSSKFAGHNECRRALGGRKYVRTSAGHCCTFGRRLVPLAQFPRKYVREMLDILQLARNYFQKIVKHLSFNRRHLTFKQAWVNAYDRMR